MNKEYDAIFIHGQGYDSLNPERPSVRGELQGRTVKVLHKKGFSFGTYVFSGIRIGGNIMPMSQVNAREVHREAGVSPDSMIIDETARTTSMEVAFSSKIARERNWRRVAHLTYGEVHPDQVRQHVAVHFDKGIEVDVFRADEVLTDPSDLSSPEDLRDLEVYQNFISAYNASDAEQELVNKYERPKNTFMGWKFDHGNKILNFLSRVYRPDPTQAKKTN